jgi:hypothetical protein
MPHVHTHITTHQLYKGIAPESLPTTENSLLATDQTESTLNLSTDNKSTSNTVRTREPDRSVFSKHAVDDVWFCQFLLAFACAWCTTLYISCLSRIFCSPYRRGSFKCADFQAHRHLWQWCNSDINSSRTIALRYSTTICFVPDVSFAEDVDARRW